MEINLAHHFDFDGHRYKIYRRPKTPTGTWYLQIQKSGRRLQRSLDTTVQKLGETNAKRLIAAVKAERWTALAENRVHREFANLETILASYEKNTDGRKAATVHNNIKCFRFILKRARGLENLATVSSSILIPKLVLDYKEKVVAAFPKDLSETDRVRAKRTANSTLRQARSLFSRHSLLAYEAAGLKLPDLAPFLKTPHFAGVRKTNYQVPDDAIIQTTFRALHRLRTSGHPEKRNRFLAVALACGAGLRKSEISQVAWDWFITISGRPFIRADKIFKNGEGINLPFQREWHAHILELRPIGAKDTDPILTSNTATDLENIFRRISRWMRKLGWKTQKTIHEFRAYIGSRIASVHGLDAARVFMRHKDHSTTLEAYGRYIKLSNVDVTLTPQQL